MKEDDCLFCTLQKDKSIVLKQNTTFYSIYDINPANQGHCLVIPKRHITSYFMLTDQEILDLHHLIKEIKKLLEEEMFIDGYNIGTNEGKAAGKTVDHLIFHIIPRYKGDVIHPEGGIRNILKYKG